MIMMIKVEDAVRAISNVDDYAGSAKALAATTLRLIFISACCFSFLKRLLRPPSGR